MLAEALAAAGARGLERLDAQLLLLHLLGRPETDRAWLLAHDTDTLADAAQAAFLGLCERRAAGEPLAYIVGHKEFFGLDLLVDRHVLVPRPETETLVEWSLEVLGRHPGPGSSPGFQHPGSIARMGDQAGPGSRSEVRNDSPYVIDLGTGTGAIALAIKKHCPCAQVEAVDASANALKVAAQNARALSLEIALRQSSWLDGTCKRYDLIVSNPPYVAAGDLHLAALKHEPPQALAAGPDGLQDIRIIIDQAPAHLRAGGWLLLEHGWDQAEAVRELLGGAGLRGIATRRDLAGIERCSGGKGIELG